MTINVTAPLNPATTSVQYTEHGEYHYFASFAVSFGVRAVPTTDDTIKIKKIWFDGELKFDPDNGLIAPGFKFHFLPGTEDQMPVAGTELPYRGQIVIWFESVDVGTSGQLPTVSAEFVDDTTPTLGEALTFLAERAGYDSADIQVSDSLNDIDILGYIIDGQATLETVSSNLAFLYDFTFTQASGNVYFTQSYDAGVFTITLDIGSMLAVLREGSADNAADVIALGSNQQLPSRITANFFDVDNNYQQGSQTADKEGTGNEINLTLPIIMTGAEMRSRLFDALARSYDERNSHSLRLPPMFGRLDPGDTIAWNNYGTDYAGIITRGTLNADWSTSVTVVERGSELHSNDVATTPPNVIEQIVVPYPVRTLVIDVPDTDPALTNDGTLNFRAIMGAVTPGQYRGARFDIAIVPNMNNWVPAFIQPNDAGIGELIAFSDADTLVFNKKNFVNTRFVETDDAGIAAGNNKMIVGANGRWEILQWRFKSIVGSTVTLTGLERGLFGTDDFTGLHVAGDSVVFVDDTTIVRYTVSDFRKDVQYVYRGVGAFQKLKDVAVNLYVPQGNSRKPYSPNNIVCHREVNGDVTFEWERDTQREAEGFTGEPDEVYQADIFNATWQLVRRVYNIPIPKLMYSVAKQTTDGLELETDHNILIYQMNASHVGRGFPGGGTLPEIARGILSGRFGPLAGLTVSSGLTELVRFGPLGGLVARLMGGHISIEGSFGPLAGLSADLTVTGGGVIAAPHRYWRINFVANQANDFYMGVGKIGLEVGGIEVTDNTMTASASSTFPAPSAYNPSYVLDPAANQGWVGVAPGSSWWKVDLGSGNDQQIDGLYLTPDTGNAARAPGFFTVASSDNNTDWLVEGIFTAFGGWTSAVDRFFTTPTTDTGVYIVNGTWNQGVSPYTSIPFNLPAGGQSGDRLVMILSRGSNGTVQAVDTPPTGWSVVDRNFQRYNSQQIFAKDWTSGDDDAALTQTIGEVVYSEIFVMLIRGADVISNWVTATESGENTDPREVPSVTLPDDGLLVASFSQGFTDTGGVTFDSALRKYLDQRTPGGSTGSTSLAVATVQLSAGATSVYTSVPASGDMWSTIALAIPKA